MHTMERLPHATYLGRGPDPLAVAAAWPQTDPLLALLSARGGSPLARWSILATQAERATVETPVGGAEQLLSDLDSLLPSPTLEPTADPDAPPFRGGRLLVLSYDLGRQLEPQASHSSAPTLEKEGPLAISLECPSALVHDRVKNVWWRVGEEKASRPLESLLDITESPGTRIPCEPLLPELDDDTYAELVARTIEYVHAGDLFQANIARRFSTRIGLQEISTRRRFATSLLEESGAWFGAIIEVDPPPHDSTIVSLSPELFLQFDPITQSLRTRPIKGTLPAGKDPRELETSEKDAAELAMIVDLMRNDLGRICDTGSIEVVVPRSIESHPGVIHGVAEVQGRLRESVRFGELLQSTFPPGSVSGAPKVRAMQVIDELEPVRRGPYCGSLGFHSNCGRFELDVSIRTLLIDRLQSDGKSPFSHQINYGAGCGIVAESTPSGEVAESGAKAALLARFLETHNEIPLGLIEKKQTQAHSLEKGRPEILSH